MPRCFATSSSQLYRISALTFKLVTAITVQTRDGSHVFRNSTHVVDGLQLIHVFSSFGVVHFQRFLCGSSCTGGKDPHQLGTGIS